MAGVLDVFELLGVALEAGSEIEALGPAASKIIAKELSALGWIDDATKTYIEDNSWVGWTALAIGGIAVAAAAVPIGGIGAGGVAGAAGEALAATAISLADSAITALFTGTGFEAVGAFTVAEVSAMETAMQAAATALIKTAINGGATALFSASAPTIGALLQQVFGQASSAYAGTAVILPPSLPTNLQLWDEPSGSTDYTVYTTALSPTNITIHVINNPVTGDVQAIISYPSSINVPPNALTLDCGSLSGAGTDYVIINGGTVDPPTSAPPYITEASDGSVIIGLPMGDGGQALIVNYDTGGTIALELGNVGDISGEQIAAYDASDFSRDTITVSESAGTTILDTEIGSTATAEIDTDFSVPAVVGDYTFVSNDGALKLDNAGSFAGTIYGFVLGDAIDLSGVASVTGVMLGAGNVLTINETGGGSITLQLDPTQALSGVTFTTEPDDSGGTDVIEETLGTGSGTQTTTIVTQTNPSIGLTTSYTATVSITPTDIQFPAFRSDSLPPPGVPITATLSGGSFNPNGGNIIAIDGPSATDVANLSGEFFVSTDSPSATGQIDFDTALPGDYTNTTLPLTLTYNADGDVGSSTIDVTISGKVYAPAIPEFLVNGTPSLGIIFPLIHVGQTATMDVAIANVATGALIDTLASSPGSLDEFTAENGISDIAAGSQGTVTVTMTGDAPGSVLITDSRPLFGLVSHDSDLPDEGVTLQNIPAIEGEVYDYANPIFSNSEIGTPVGTLTTDDGIDWTLDLGTVTLGSVDSLAQVEIANDTPSLLYSDDLEGSYSLSASPDGGFAQALGNLAGQSAPGGGNSMALGVIEPDSTDYGTHTESIVFDPLSVDTAGTTALQSITLTVTDDIALPDIPGANLTVQGATVTAAVDAGQDAILDPLILDATINTLVLEGPGTAEFDNQSFVSNLEVASGGHLTVPGNTLGLNQIIVDSGGEISGSGTVGGISSTDGTITAAGGILDLSDNLSGTGTLTFNPGATLFLEGSVVATESILFNAPNEILGLGMTADIQAPISGFAAGDFIGLYGQQVTSAIYDPSQHTLAVTGSGGGVYSLDFVGSYQPGSFFITDGAVGVTCFLVGTGILALHGEVPVETLVAGDLVHVESGGVAPVKWIGYRRLDCSRHPDPRKVWPVRIAAGAFGEQRPHRDLWLSPDHAVFVDDVLIPVKHLINGTTIAQIPVDDVTYYHVELHRHDVLLAEGLTVESYLDTGNRALFANGGGAMTLHPTFDVPRTWADDAAAPLATDEARVKPVWERVAARSQTLGLPLPVATFTDDPAVHLQMNGRTIRPVVTEQHRRVFVLPKRTGPIRLLSRSGFPTDKRPWADDWRRLGTSVSRIVWHDREGPHDMPVDHPALDEGWWAVEREEHRLWRWTNGDALLPLPPDAAMIEIQFVGGMAYRIGETRQTYGDTPVPITALMATTEGSDVAAMHAA